MHVFACRLQITSAKIRESFEGFNHFIYRTLYECVQRDGDRLWTSTINVQNCWKYFSIKSKDKNIIDNSFEQIKVTPRRRVDNNKRYRDTRHTVNLLPFYNINRSTVYNQSPYDETLVIDVDYLICNNTLNAVWNHKEDLLINKKSFDLLSGRHDNSFDRVDDFGIDFYWATAFYFKKSEETQIFFNLLEAESKSKT